MSKRRTKEPGRVATPARKPRNPGGRHKQRPWHEDTAILRRVETVYALHLGGLTVREVAARAKVPRSTVHEDIRRGRQLAREATGESLAELRADSLSRIGLMQRRALEAFESDPCPHWLTIAAGLEKLRVSVEGTAAPHKRAVDAADYGNGEPLTIEAVLRESLRRARGLDGPVRIVKEIGGIATARGEQVKVTKR